MGQWKARRVVVVFIANLDFVKPDRNWITANSLNHAFLFVYPLHAGRLVLNGFFNVKRWEKIGPKSDFNWLLGHMGQEMTNSFQNAFSSHLCYYWICHVQIQESCWIESLISFIYFTEAQTTTLNKVIMLTKTMFHFSFPSDQLCGYHQLTLLLSRSPLQATSSTFYDFQDIKRFNSNLLFQYYYWIKLKIA